ncbi:MAG: NAD(P)H-hydrate dehydratase [Magnetococcales bacterium]|nr:NAD(P)H-hydrate dehydratase [Magnetococcales bacterium]
MMSRLLTAAQMQAADRRTIEELGLPGVVLMENAGAAVVAAIYSRMPSLQQLRPVLILAGMGNNGGDGFVVARRLLTDGIRVKVLLFGRMDQVSGDARIHGQVFLALGGELVEMQNNGDMEPFPTWLAHASLVVDALFGTGLSRPINNLPAHAITMVNAAHVPVMAIDLPSGIDADSGRVLGCAIQAHWSVAIAAEKIGHRLHPGAAHCGEVILAPIGIPDRLINIPEHRVAINRPDDLVLPQRPVNSHKGHFGHLLILAGSMGKSGAAVLTAMGALRVGPGLVTVATPSAVLPQIAVQVPEAMTLALPDYDSDESPGINTLDTILSSGFHPRAMAIGPGLGNNRRWSVVLQELLTRMDDIPAVLDADALNLLVRNGVSSIARLAGERKAPLVITPHPGEMSRLVGLSVDKIQSDRLEIAMRTAQEWKVWVVLKGAGTIIATPAGQAWINTTGNPSLAVGGSGDLLTGIIAGLMTQGMAAEQACRYGVWLHGASADALASSRGGPIGILARDLLPHLEAIHNQRP